MNEATNSDLLYASTKFPVGSYAVCNVSGRAFKVISYSLGNPLIPDGWLTDRFGFTANPEFCRPYNGAISAMKGNNH